MAEKNIERRKQNKLKEDREEQMKLIECLRSQINEKEEEIHQLKCQLEKIGMAPTSMTTAQMIQELKSKDKLIATLRSQINDTLSKQHAAMTNAIRLAKKNCELESELREVDRLALTVEAECNTTLKGNSEKMSTMQEQLEESLHKVYNLEKKNAELEEMICFMKKNMEESEIKNKETRSCLMKALEKKDCELMEVRSNEKELICEAEKMKQTLKCQKNRIIDLENKLQEKEMLKEKSKEPNLTSRRIHITMKNSVNSSKPSERNFSEFEPCSRESVSRGNKKRITTVEIKKSAVPFSCHGDDQQIDLKDSVEELPQQIDRCGNIIEKDKSITGKTHCLPSSPVHSLSIKNVITRLERERDIARADVKRLQEEIDSLRDRLQLTTEVQMEEKCKYEKCLAEEVERVRKLEIECRDLHKNQGLLKGKVEGQEDNICKLKEYLKTAKMELNQKEKLYYQLKNLHEKTECSLLKSKEKATKLEEELKFRMDQRNEKEAIELELNCLQKENTTLQEKITKLGHDKEHLKNIINEKNEMLNNIERKKRMKCNPVSLSLNSCDELQEKYMKKHAMQEVPTAVIKKTDILRTDIHHEINELKEKLSRQEIEKKKLKYMLEVKEGENYMLKSNISYLKDKLHLLKQEKSCFQAETESCTKINKVKDESLYTKQKEASCGYKDEVTKLTNIVATIEKQQKIGNREKAALEEHLCAAHKLCEKLDDQKTKLLQIIKSNDMNLNNMELEQLMKKMENLQCLNERQKECIASLEQQLIKKRKELIECQLSNQKLQLENKRLKHITTDLKKNLEEETEGVKRYKRKIRELSALLQDIQKETCQKREQRELLIERRQRSHSQTPTRTKITFETEEDNKSSESLGSECADAETSNALHGHKSCHKQRVECPEITREKNCDSKVLPGPTCSFKTRNRTYNVEVKGSSMQPKLIVEHNNNAKHSRRQQCKQSSVATPRIRLHLPLEADDSSDPVEEIISFSPSSQIHLETSLHSGSELSIQLEEKGDYGDVDYYSYHSSSS